MGWLPNRLPAAVVWLDIDVSACRALAVAWLERGATADRSEIRHAAATGPRRNTRGKGAVDGGSDDRGGPHKGSHTAVVIDQVETVLGEVRVRASAAQAGRLLAWAAAWPERTWVVEGAGGLGHLLARQPRPGPSKATRPGSSRRTRRLVPGHTSA